MRLALFKQGYQLRIATEFDEDAGEVRLVMQCVKCRQQETVSARTGAGE